MEVKLQEGSVLVPIGANDDEVQSAESVQGAEGRGRAKPQGGLACASTCAPESHCECNADRMHQVAR
eukprot:scaffold70093_cov31-Tisochrysis_lutea.AAC.3